MKIRMKSSVILLSLLMLQFVPALAQNPGQVDNLVTGFERSGQAAMPFLALGAGARPMGMGDAVLALKGDVSSMYYNPAGLAYVEQNSVMLGNMSWLLDTNLMHGAFAHNFGDRIGTFGVNFMYYDYGDPIMATEINATTEFGYSDVGTLEPSQFAIGLAYARQITPDFAIGGQVKVAHEDLLGSGNTTGIAFQEAGGSYSRQEHKANETIVAFDFGTIFNTRWRDLLVAMSIRNFGSAIKYEAESFELPLTFRIAVSGDFFTLMNNKQDNQSLLLNVDYMHPRDWSERIIAGLEYGYNDMLFLRGGYKFNYTSEGVTLGAGVQLNISSMGKVRVDYAYKHTSDTLFDAVHVYSLNLAF